MNDWKGTLTRIQAIRILDSFINKDNLEWEWAVDEFYDEESDTIPSIMQVFAALSITEEEYREATGLRLRGPAYE